MEDNTLELTFNPEEESDGRDLTLVGKVMSPKVINSKIISAVLDAAWNLGPNVRFRQLDVNVMACMFTYKEDLVRIKESGPWAIKGAIFNLQPWPAHLNLQEIDFSHCAMWIQIHNLPRNRMNEENAIRLGNFLGKFLRSAEDFHPENIRSFLRIQVSVNILSSLKTSCDIRREDGSILKIDFKYEKLPDFCYVCGLLSHSMAACPSPRIEGRETEFGPWLRAKPVSPGRSGKKVRPEKLLEFKPSPESEDDNLEPRLEQERSNHDQMQKSESWSQSPTGRRDPHINQKNLFQNTITFPLLEDKKEKSISLMESENDTIQCNTPQNFSLDSGPSTTQYLSGRPTNFKDPSSFLISTHNEEPVQSDMDPKGLSTQLIQRAQVINNNTHLLDHLPFFFFAENHPHVEGLRKRKMHDDSQLFKKSKLGGEEWMQETFAKLNLHTEVGVDENGKEPSGQVLQEIAMEERVEVVRRRFIQIKKEARRKGLSINSGKEKASDAEARWASRQLPTNSP